MLSNIICIDIVDNVSIIYSVLRTCISHVIITYFAGYYNNEEETARIIDNNGWLHTGDIGYIDDDENVFIVDRIKELIKYKGFQVRPLIITPD